MSYRPLTPTMTESTNPMVNLSSSPKIGGERNSEEEVDVVEKPRESVTSLQSDLEANDDESESSSKKQEKYETNGILGRFFFVWSQLKKHVKSIYKNFKMPVLLVPFRDWIDDYFECTRNGSSVEIEFFAGLLNFFSCMYMLSVIPFQMESAGYDAQRSAAIVSLLTGIFSIVCGIITNLPMIIAPTTAMTVYYVSNIQQYNLTTHQGNMSVSYAGIIVILVGLIGPLGRLISKLIPEYIQYSVTIGIGLMTAFSGLVEIDLVVQGKYTLLAVGPITSEIVIAMSGLILIAIGVFYKSKVSYMIGLFWGTIIWWTSQKQWPVVWGATPHVMTDSLTTIDNGDCILLVFEVFLLILLSLFGLAKALCDLAHITPTDESIPRGRLLIMIIGFSNLISGMFNGPPIIISPESASGIKAGSKTGLSSVVAGFLFILSVFFAPFFSSIPAAGTTPVLIMIGMLLFQNIMRIDFSTKYAMPAFMCMTIIPFTDSIIGGIGFGYATYIVIAVLTGDFTKQAKVFFDYYCNPSGGGDSEAEIASLDIINPNVAVLALTGVSSGGSGSSKMTPQRKMKDRSVSSKDQSSSAMDTSVGGDSTGAGSRARSVTNPDPVVTRARRASVAFFDNLSTEVNLQSDFKGTMLQL